MWLIGNRLLKVTPSLLLLTQGLWFLVGYHVRNISHTCSYLYNLAALATRFPLHSGLKSWMKVNPSTPNLLFVRYLVTTIRKIPNTAKWHRGRSSVVAVISLTMWSLSLQNCSEGKTWKSLEMGPGKALEYWNQDSVSVWMAQTLVQIWAVKITPTEYLKEQESHWELRFRQFTLHSCKEFDYILSASWYLE